MRKFLLTLILCLLGSSIVYGEEPIKITSNDLLSEFQKNRISGEKKFGNKTLVVSGKVGDVTKDYQGIYVMFQRPDPMSYLKKDENGKLIVTTNSSLSTVRGYFNSDDGLENLNQGDHITLQCVFGNIHMNMFIDLKNCSIVK